MNEPADDYYVLNRIAYLDGYVGELEEQGVVVSDEVRMERVLLTLAWHLRGIESLLRIQTNLELNK